jgi:hypothetical protein
MNTLKSLANASISDSTFGNYVSDGNNNNFTVDTPTDNSRREGNTVYHNYAIPLVNNAKGVLLEASAKRLLPVGFSLPSISIVSTGADHQRRFTSSFTLNGIQHVFRGARTKLDAEQCAYYYLLTCPEVARKLGSETKEPEPVSPQLIDVPKLQQQLKDANEEKLTWKTNYERAVEDALTYKNQVEVYKSELSRLGPKFDSIQNDLKQLKLDSADLRRDNELLKSDLRSRANYINELEEKNRALVAKISHNDKRSKALNVLLKSTQDEGPISSQLISALLQIGGVEQNPGPIVEANTPFSISQESLIRPPASDAPTGEALRARMLEILAKEPQFNQPVYSSNMDLNRILAPAYFYKDEPRKFVYTSTNDGFLPNYYDNFKPTVLRHNYFNDPDELAMAVECRCVNCKEFIRIQLMIGGVEQNPGPTNKISKNEENKIERAVERKISRKVRKIVKGGRKSNSKPKVVVVKTTTRPRKGRRNGNRRKPRMSKQLDTVSGVGQALSLVDAIVLSFVDPSGSQFVRYASEYTSEETAISSPWISIDCKWDTSNLSADHLFAVLFPSVERWVIHKYEGTVPAYEYTFSFVNGSATHDIDYGDIAATDKVPIPFILGTSTGANEIHGPNMYGGTLNGNRGDQARWIWVDSGSHITFDVTVSFTFGVDEGVEFTIDRFDGHSINYSVGLASKTATGSVDFTITDNGYYCLWAQTNGAGDASDSSYIRISNLKETRASSSGPVYCHLPIQGFQSMRSSMDSYRCLGQKVLYTNRSAPDDRAGEMISAQLHTNQWWLDFDDPDVLGSIQGSDRDGILNGLHRWRRVADAKDFELKSYHQVNSAGDMIDSWYPITPPTDYLMVMANVGVLAGRNARWTFGTNFEFTTKNTNFPIGSSNVSATAYRLALEKMKHMKATHENPKHVGKLISEMLGKTMSYAKRGATFANQVHQIASLMSTMM